MPPILAKWWRKKSSCPRAFARNTVSFSKTVVSNQTRVVWLALKLEISSFIVLLLRSLAGLDLKKFSQELARVELDIVLVGELNFTLKQKFS